jgi:hypothetical protein
VAKFDIVAADGKLIVAKDKRITAKHIRDIQTASWIASKCRLMSCWAGAVAQCHQC